MVTFLLTFEALPAASIRWFGAAAVVVGVVAQYLQLHPYASPSQVRQALLRDFSTKDDIMGIYSSTALLYTNATQNTPVDLISNAGTDNSSLGTIATVGIAFAASLGKSVPLRLHEELKRNHLG